MYSKEETKQIKQEFWTAFGIVMKPHFSTSGFKINWINYKTGVRNISFKMEASNKQVSISIKLDHKDEGIRDLYYEQFIEFKTLLHTILEEEWEWNRVAYDLYSRECSSISIAEKGNIFDKDQWQDMFAFLKQRMIRLDAFWDDAKEIFKAL